MYEYFCHILYKILYFLNAILDSKLGGISYDGLESLHDKAMDIFGENSMTVYHANNHPTLSCASTQGNLNVCFFFSFNSFIYFHFPC